MKVVIRNTHIKEENCSKCLPLVDFIFSHFISFHFIIRIIGTKNIAYIPKNLYLLYLYTIYTYILYTYTYIGNII